MVGVIQKMIAPYLIKNNFMLIKTIKGKKGILPSISEVLDHKYVIPENIINGSLPNWARARPFYTMPYESMFCHNAPNCGIDCPDCAIAFETNGDDYFSDCNIGIMCGAVNGLVAIDNDTGLSIDEFRKYLEKKGLPLPETWTTITPSQGQHFYFKYDGKFPSDIGKFCAGVDFIADNRHLTIPPSYNEKGSYEWLIPPSNNIANLPIEYLSLKIHKAPDPPPKKQQAFLTDRNKDREDVENTLSMVRVENVSGSDWIKIGYSLCSNGFEYQFRDWCHSDSRPNKMYKEQQIKAFRNPNTITSLGVALKILKNYF